MIFTKVEELMKSDAGRAKLVKLLQPTFDRLESISEELREKASEFTAKEVEVLFRESNGLLTYLKPVYKALETIKTNKEVIFCSTEKMRIEKEGAKFNVSATEKEASAQVAEERRMRNCVEAYLEMAQSTFNMCQSHLKWLGEEIKTERVG
jgi:hypothetical protein